MTESAPKLRIADLRRAANRLLDEAERRHGPEIDLPVDNYWQVHLREAYDLVDDAAAAMGAGQTSDDIDELVEFLERPADEVYLWHDLDHLTGLLRAIAYLDLPPVGNVLG
jgi:hypothetical protein